MEIKIRKRASATTGKTSLSLEYYLGYTKDENGKIKHKRKFETLEYFLYTHPKTAVEKDHNKTNLQMAEAVKAKRLLAFQNKQYGFTVDFKIRTNLVEYIRGLIEQRKESPGNWGNWDSALKHLIAYAGEDTTFETVDKEFVTGFKNYLEKKARTKSNTRLSANSQNSYFLKLKATLNQAVEDGIIPNSPATHVKTAKAEDVHREYLTIEELQRLVKTDCKFPIMKQAFLFSCLTGLRWSDIQKLTWSEEQQLDGMTRVVFRQKKTKGFEYLDISDQAVKYLGERGKPDERVFIGLKYSAWHNMALQRWCMDAGINKTITFHCGRHTFAVLQLSLGTEIYTVSKLLGHKELKTTEVYARILDEKKREAVNKIPEL